MSQIVPGSKDSLSEREREIVHLASKGATDKEICSRLGLTLPTVRTYWERIRTKLGVSNRAHAVARMSAERPARAQTEVDAFLSDLRKTSLVLWVWNPRSRRVSLDKAAQRLFRIEGEASAVSLSTFMRSSVESDRRRLTNYLCLVENSDGVPTFDHRIASDTDEEGIPVRTVRVAITPSETEGRRVLLATSISSNLLTQDPAARAQVY